MPPPFKTTWRVYIPGMFVGSCVAGVIYFSKHKQQNIKRDHDFVPIYGEDGKLEGFTHPVFVAAGDAKRASNQLQQQQQQQK